MYLTNVQSIKSKSFFLLQTIYCIQSNHLYRIQFLCLPYTFQLRSLFRCISKFHQLDIAKPVYMYIYIYSHTVEQYKRHTHSVSGLPICIGSRIGLKGKNIAGCRPLLVNLWDKIQFISNDALTCPRSISSITTQSILLSRHATVWINHWTRTCTPCKVAFDVDQLSRLIVNEYLVKIYLLSVNIYETPTFQDFFIVIFSSWKAVIKLLVAFARKILI